MNAAGAGATDAGFAGSTVVLPLSSVAGLPVELVVLASGVLSSSLQAALSMHSDTTINALVKRLRREAAVGCDRTDMACLRHGEGVPGR